MAPLLSVLLPTRDRLQYLRYAVQTVLRQDDPDLELVISDNQSADDIAGYVDSLQDDRVVYRRTARALPVTDNWNAALDMSTGRYVVMLGDDDGLMPGFVDRVRRLSTTFDDPDLIYQAAWLYAYPGVFPEEPEGYLQPYGYASFFGERTAPFVLDPAVAVQMVRRALRFQVRYGFNMQFSTVSRQLLDRVAARGPFYQGAFPDYYATNAAFLAARRIVVEPRPMVVIGVTPKSYGYFHANKDEEAGKDFLEVRGPDRAAEMPGTNINTGWLSSLEALAKRYPDLVPTKPAVGRFRFLQASFVYEGHFLRREVTREQLETLETYLTPLERRIGRLAMAISVTAKRVLPGRITRGIWATFHHRGVGQFVAWNPPKVRGRFGTLLDVFEAPPPAPRSGRRPWRQRLRRTTV